MFTSSDETAWGVAPCRHVPTHFFSKCPQNVAAAIDICVMYRPDQPALSAQTDPADTFRLRGIEAKSVNPGRPVCHA